MIYFLRGVLGLIGLVVIWLGLNVGLGGMQTLGWQGPTDFMQITDAAAFAVQDNHTRFLAGVWAGVGLFFLVGAVYLHRFAPLLKALTILVCVGGLARLTVGDPALVFSANIAPSLIAELVGFPLLGLWIHRATAEPEHD